MTSSLLETRGAWLKFETDRNDLVWVRIDKTRKLSAQVLLKALGLSDNEIFDALRHPEYFQKTIEKEGQFSEEEALMELYRKLRPGEPPTVLGGQQLLDSRFFDPKRYDLGRVGRYKLNKKLGLQVPETVRVLTPQDILASVDYLINLEFDIGSTDDIDHLGNRRVRSVGELLQNQVRVGLNRLERIIRERMTVSDAEVLTPASLVNPKPLVAAIKEFFGSSQLSQFMDQTNPLAELTHKRRLSALGPGGLTRERAGFAVRDIHPSHYGRICPVETPEGPNAGLIGSLATHARVNQYGFLETPFRSVENGRVQFDKSAVYMTADEEDDLRVAAGDVPVDENGYIIGPSVTVRYRQEFSTTTPEQVDYVAVSPVQIVSVATSMIPFLEHDDANRALMGSNMQRQAVPMLKSPTKARTIRNYLPAGYRVEASMGHVRDLPQSASEIPATVKGEKWAQLGVNVDADFEPLYVVPKDKKKVVTQLKDALKEVDELILATDEDREGESISWHLYQLLKPKVPTKRMVFHEITQDAIKKALKNCRDIDEQLVRAQETRRILDRLVGYTLSPLLWKKIAWGLSAGRVQSVAVRLLVNKERQRRAFRQGSYWDLKATLLPPASTKGSAFTSQLITLKGIRLANGGDFDPATGKIPGERNVVLLNQEQAEALREELLGKTWKVTDLEERPVTRKPAPPFTTSTLQQESNRKLRLSARDTMRIAQSLYEQGYITYMRTDSVHLSDQAIAAARDCVEKLYGKEYLSPQARQYTTKSKGAQEAHEAIRPAGSTFRTPQETALSGRELQLYDLIWKRTVACQM
ncbi:type I DNA topoisomerase, partial [Scytonema sp. NUACC21]